MIYAVNVHQGGGAVLLTALLHAAAQSDVPCFAFLDTRLRLPEKLGENIQVHRIMPRISSRFSAELKLKNCLQEHDRVLFFGNLPPLFKLAAKTILYLQNRTLIDSATLKHYKIKAKLRVALERVWLKSRCKNIDTIVIQTPSMQRCVHEKLCRDSVIMPFLDTINITRHSALGLTPDKLAVYDFLYVASGEPHKNHKNLVEAWALLAAEGIHPALCLTLSRENCSELVEWIDTKVQKFNLKIVNVGVVDKIGVDELYKQSKSLIYPSTLESFGLPLVEARNAGLAIVASELDYVRDVLDPEETFDPSSPRSIARAVKRFLALDEEDLPLVDSKAFLNFCIDQYN
jgi:glycosyltransferase involved in cell wall biosynthesis